MSLETPDKIRSLQRKLYCKAKAEPAFRFYILYDKICREDILRHAYELSRANAGAPGVDGTTFEQIEASGVEGWLAGLCEDLVSKTYRPDPVRRVMIPKPNGGGERALGSRCAAIFDEMPQHTPREAVIAATEMARAVKADVIVTVGGGSCTASRRHPALQLALSAIA